MIVMLCTRSRGGMRSVVEAYRSAGLFERHQIHLLYTHDEGSLARRLVLALWSLLCFAVLLMRGQVTLLHAHISMRGSFWRKSIFAAMARCFGVPVIGHLHGSDFDRFVAEQPAWARGILKSQLERMAAVLVLGESWRQFVLSIAPAAHVVVLPNSVPIPEMRAAHLERDTVELLFLGIVGARKGVYDLLKAFASAHSNFPALRLTVAGNGEIEKASQAAAALGVSAFVTFVGWLDGEAKKKLLEHSDIYVLPSHNEGLPVSILEAMSWGLPVISTNVGAIAELVRHDIDGLIVPAGAPGPLAQALLQLANSRELRLKMGNNGRQRVLTGFSDEVVLPRLEGLYDEAQLESKRKSQENATK